MAAHCLRRALSALALSLSALALLPVCAWSQSPPIELRSEWLRGSWGHEAGALGLVAAHLGDGDPGLEWVAATSLYGSDPYGDPEADHWYVVDRHSATGFSQVWRSGETFRLTSLTAGDVDGDGIDEIVLGVNGSVEIWDGWPLALDRTWTTPATRIDSLRVADIDLDGTAEIVFVDRSNPVYVLDAVTGAVERTWTDIYGARVAVGQVDGDAALEVICDGFVVDGVTGALEFESTSGWGGLFVEVGELDGTGAQEIVAGWDGWLTVVSWTGSSYSETVVIQPAVPIHAVALGDVDGDGTDEIVTGDEGQGLVRIYEPDGTQIGTVANPLPDVNALLVAPLDDDLGVDLLWSAGAADTPPHGLFFHDPAAGVTEWQSSDGRGWRWDPAWGDVDGDGDGDLELVVSTLATGNGVAPGRYFVHRPDGGLEYSSPLIGGDYGLHAVALGQLDGDPQLEIVLAAWNDTSPVTSTLHVIDGATHVQQFEIPHGDEVVQLEVADVDQDGTPEIVAAGGTTVVVYAGDDGAFEWSPDLGTFSAVATLAIGDFDAALSGPELVVSADTSLYAYNGTTHEQIYPEAAYGTVSSLSVQPGTPDVLWVGNEQGIVSKASWDPFGSPESPLDTGFDEVRSLVVADLNQDGDDDFVFVSRDWNTYLSELVVLSGADGTPLAVQPLPEIEAGSYDSVRVDDFDGDGWTEIWVNRAEGGFEIFEVFVDAPQVTLLSPTPPVSLTDLDEIHLSAVAVDPTDGDVSAAITWTSDLDGLLATGGQAWVGLGAGTHTITAEAVDSQGNRGAVSFQAVVASTVPAVTVSSPEDGLRVGLNTAVDFAATALDGEDGDLSQDLVWMSDLIGTVGYGPSLSLWDLPAGTHAITASVTDSNLKTGEATVTVTVVDPATCSPTGERLFQDFESGMGGWDSAGLWHLSADSACLTPAYASPVTSAYFGDEATCTFDTGAQVYGFLSSPPFVVAPAAELRFSHFREVEFGGSTYDWAEVAIDSPISGYSLLWRRTSADPPSTAWETVGPFSLAPWEGEEIQLVFSFDSMDSGGNDFLGWMVDDIEVTGDTCIPANTVPVVTVEAPAYGATVATDFTLVGSVVDPEETDPTADLEWWSAGQLLGTGGSLPVTLAPGTVYIEGRYTDSAGAPAFDGIQVTVIDDQPPTVDIGNLATNELDEGQATNLYASASDPEDGDLTAAIQWSSDLDGPLGTGSPLSVVLSAGTHTITATATDSRGQVGTGTTQRIVHQTAPFVDILTPDRGFRVGLNTAIDFTASAEDFIDGDLADALAFTSDRVGLLGTGRTLSIHDLPAGIHVITASVTDSDGLTGEASVTIDVADPASCFGDAFLQDFESGAQGWSTSGLWHLADDTPCASPGYQSPVHAAYFGSEATCTYGGGTQVGELVSPSFVVPLEPSLQFHHRYSVQSINTVKDKPELLVEEVATGLRTSLWQLSTQASPSADWQRWGTTDVWTWPSLSSYLQPFEGQEIRLVFRFDTVDSGGNDYLGWLVDDVWVTGRTCLPANTPPAIVFEAPTDGATVSRQTTLEASVVDPDETGLSAVLEWWLDGQLLGTGASLPVDLPVGPATLEARVTDGAGYPVSETITVTVVDNLPPTVNLWLPTALDFDEGESIRFTGDASDPEDGDLSAALQWSSDLDGPLGTGAEIDAALSAGDHTITLSVTDSFGASDSATKQLTIHPNTPPVVQLMEPGDVVALEGETVWLDAVATDSVDGDLSAAIEWSSSLDGALGTGSSLQVTTLSRGTHTITASATDSLGATGSASQSVRIHGAPTVGISTPADGTSAVETDPVTFTAAASDPDDGDLTASIAWSSSRDGAIGAGGSFTTTALSVGTHTVTTSVTDADGVTATDTVTVTVEANTAPLVWISEPHYGLHIEVGESVTFIGGANDDQDGDLTATIAWDSSIDGPLGTGGSVTATPSEGRHVITATVVDRHGESTSVLIVLEVEPAVPSLVLLEPADGATVSADGPTSLRATADDFRDGDLDSDITWTSSIDGKIGYRGAVDRRLTAGVHTLTASVTDSDGETATASITLTVEPAPEVSITAPTDGGHAVPGGAVTLTATALGTDDVDVSGSIAWSSDLDGAVGTGGSVSTVLSTGIHRITATATDGLGRTGTATVRLFVTTDAPPVITLDAPVDRAWCYGPPCQVPLVATAVDPEDGDVSSTTSWTSSLGGLPDGDGDGVATLSSLGFHTLKYSAIDSAGNLTYRTVLYRVLDANDFAPVVAIAEPVDGASAKDGDTVVLAAGASDGDLGDVSDFVEWTLLPAGTPLGTGAILELTAGDELPVGTHTLRARLVDGALMAEETVTITVDANPAPVVTVTAPADGASVVQGDPLSFAGGATDEDDGDLTADLAWWSDLDGPLGTGGAFVVDSGALSVGTHTVTAGVSDSRGATGEASVALTVLANDAPVIDVTSPVDGGTVVQGDPVIVVATASDAQDGDLTAALAWSSDLDGSLGTGGYFDVDSLTLSLGIHTVTATVTDSHGATTTETLTVTVVANDPPTVAIDTPADGLVALDTDAVTFSATASDPQDGDLSAGVIWSSDLDGALGVTDGFVTSNLSVGTHTITAEAIDAQGLSATASVTVTVHRAPTVAISSPADGTAVLETDPVSFGASASDPDDGDLTPSIAWMSSLDGAIGTGGSVTTTALSVGSHTVTASVTDGDGEIRTDTVTVTVAANTAPTVAITTPAGPLSVVETDPVSFSATASDAEDGDLTASTAWTSDRDGLLATGASFGTAGLSVGVHEIRATVADRLGAEGFATVTVTVEANTAPTVAITAPADGTQGTVGDPVTFTATAGDAQDGDLSAAVAWSSSLDGALGAGATLGTSALSVGTHTVTATVADRHGLGASASITVTVRPQPVTVSFLSIGTEDGWILESSENSGVGGSLENLEAGGRNRDVETIRVGDDRKDEQYRSILSFDTSGIPDGAEIQSVTLVIRRGSLEGSDPFATHGSLVVDVKTGTFGTSALETSDFQALADAVAAGFMSQPASDGSDATAVLGAAGRAAVHVAGRTQLRLRFATDDDDDRSPDVLGFYAGETSSAQLPELVVTYQE